MPFSTQRTHVQFRACRPLHRRRLDTNQAGCLRLAISPRMTLFVCALDIGAAGSFKGVFLSPNLVANASNILRSLVLVIYDSVPPPGESRPCHGSCRAQATREGGRRKVIHSFRRRGSLEDSLNQQSSYLNSPLSTTRSSRQPVPYSPSDLVVERKREIYVTVGGREGGQ
jgi:hypothetical protein